MGSEWIDLRHRLVSARLLVAPGKQSGSEPGPDGATCLCKSKDVCATKKPTVKPWALCASNDSDVGLLQRAPFCSGSAFWLRLMMFFSRKAQAAPIIAPPCMIT